MVAVNKAEVTKKFLLGPVKTGKNIIVSQNLGDITFENVQKYLLNFTRGTQDISTIFTRINPTTFIRTATTLVEQNGKYAVNTPLLTTSPAYQPLLNGLNYQGYITLFDKPYYGYYSPLFEPTTGFVIGAFFVAYQLESIKINSISEVVTNNTDLLRDITGPVETGNNILITKNQGSLSFENYQPIIFSLSNKTQLVYTLFTRSGDEFIRTSTSVLEENNKYAVGTLLLHDNPAYQPILNGKSYNGGVLLFNTNYYASYTPIFDSFTGLVIGIYFSGYAI